MSARIKIVEAQTGMCQASARMPFRFGVVTMRVAPPLMTLALVIEDPSGRRATGYASDFLAYRWFDKRPGKSLADNCRDLAAALDLAIRLNVEHGKAEHATPFDLWWATHGEIEGQMLAKDCNRLTAAFGSSMIERAVIDGLGRLLGKSYFALVRDGDLGIELGRITPELAGRTLREFLPEEPFRQLHLRHTVGLIDPITAGDVAPAEEIDDGLPVTLEDYLAHDGIGYLKIKLSGAIEADIDRMSAIAAVLAKHDRAFCISLDANEQYPDLETLIGLLERIKSVPELERLYEGTMFIEQPLDRAIAMDPHLAPALAIVGRDKPVIIDEADETVGAFKQAIELGYRGTSHKNCKGIYKSLHNLALARSHNEQHSGTPLFLTAEDLSNLPVVSLQADLASVALLGITHGERNGHHYFRGLGHLSEAEQAAALADHPDLYLRDGDEVYLRIDGGTIAIASLQVPGMGFATPPDMARLTPLSSWDFSALEVQP